MDSAPFTFHIGLICSPALAAALVSVDKLACVVLCSIVHCICWMIAFCCFVFWCMYRLILGLRWLLNQVSLICIYIVGIILVILVWVGTRFVRIMILLLRTLRRLGRALRYVARRVIRWAIHELGESVGCTACVCLGVLSTSLLPLALVLQMAPTVLAGIVLSPVAAFVIAARVFDTRAHGRWQRGARARLGVRMLRAYSDGVTWVLWLRMPRSAMRQMA